MRRYFVRVGLLGHIGRFAVAGADVYARCARVVCRTQRGLELGTILAEEDGEYSGGVDGTLLRTMTVEDELLAARLEKNKDEAYRACTALLAERRLAAALIDVEPLFDGRSIYFYFLGAVTPQLEAITSRLGEAYEGKVELRKFAETMLTGCGPACGTDEATGAGCETGGCASCSIAGACAPAAK